MIYVFLAQGFEEIEAITAIDMLRRAQLPVTVAGVGGKQITGSHGITVLCDAQAEQLEPDANCRAVVLPGGLPGTTHLEHSEAVQRFLRYAATQGAYLCAICAAPSVLGHGQYLQGKKVTCYPGYEKELTGAVCCAQPAVRDGFVITGRGAGTAVEFAAEIVAAFCGRAKADAIKESMQCG